MGNIPLAATAEVWAAQCTISDGTNSYVAGKNLTMRWSYAMLQETVIGSNLPAVGTGEFRGTIELEILSSTDYTIHDLLTLSSGQVPTTTWTIGEVDNAGTQVTRTWTVVSKINQFEDVIRENDFVRVRCSGILTAVPTEAVA